MNKQYEDDFQAGSKFEDFVCDELFKRGLTVVCYQSREYQFKVGENRAGIEIKFDRNYHKTGNCYIETEERTNTAYNWTKGGIFRKDNSWLYIVGNYQNIFIFSKKQLQDLYFKIKKDVAYKGGRLVSPSHGTSLGFVIDMEFAKGHFVLLEITTDKEWDGKREVIQNVNSCQ